MLVQILVAVILTLTAHVARAEAPGVIRVAFAGVGIGNRPFVGGSSLSVVHARGLLEEEFKKDNIKIEWSFFKGAGPAVNEAYANRLLDFALQGDLPSSIGRAGGLKTKLLAGVSTRQHTYLAVPADSSIASLADLKEEGRPLQGHESAARRQQDPRGQRAVRSAISDPQHGQRDREGGAGDEDIDAAFGGYDLLALQDQGVAKIVYWTKNDSPAYLRHAHLIVTEDFANKISRHHEARRQGRRAGRPLDRAERGQPGADLPALVQVGGAVLELQGGPDGRLASGARAEPAVR